MVSYQTPLSPNQRKTIPDQDFENIGNCSRKRKRDDDTEAEEIVEKWWNPKPFSDLQSHLETPLPFEWQRFLNIQSGQIHFYNTRTHKRTMRDPRTSRQAAEPETPGTDMSLDLKLNLPCGSLSSLETENNHKKQNTSSPPQNSSNYFKEQKNLVDKDKGQSPFLSLSSSSIDSDQQEMVATVCMQCHMLVILCKSSPACPNCKFLHPPDQSPPKLLKSKLSLSC
ncbi:hypothetical protein Ancab_038454 [Ancistrocladus abbreviatus]